MIKVDLTKLEGEVVLHLTQKLDFKNPESTEQADLVQLYKDMRSTGNTVAMYCASIVNMIVTQRRFVFTIAFRVTGNAIRKDKNHRYGFDNNKYKVLHNMLVNDLKLIELVKQGSGMAPSAYRVIHPDVRRLIVNACESDQEKQTLEFIQARENKTKAEVDAENQAKLEKQSAKQSKSGRPKDWKTYSPIPVRKTEKNSKGESFSFSKEGNSKTEDPKKQNSTGKTSFGRKLNVTEIEKLNSALVREDVLQLLHQIWNRDENGMSDDATLFGQLEELVADQKVYKIISWIFLEQNKEKYPLSWKIHEENVQLRYALGIETKAAVGE